MTQLLHGSIDPVCHWATFFSGTCPFLQQRPIGLTLKTKFTPDEDAKLQDIVTAIGTNDWSFIASLHGTRNARQCRERYQNYLAPTLRVDPWSPEEDMLLLEKYAEFGSRWNAIAKFFTNRSPNSLRNQWQLLRRRDEREQRKATKAANPAPSPPSAGPPPLVCPQIPQAPLPDVISVETRGDDLLSSLFELLDRCERGSDAVKDPASDLWTQPIFF
jgi:hypothetical protein